MQELDLHVSTSAVVTSLESSLRRQCIPYREIFSRKIIFTTSQRSAGSRLASNCKMYLNLDINKKIHTGDKKKLFILINLSPEIFILNINILFCNWFYDQSTQILLLLAIFFCKRIKKIESHRAGSIDDDDEKKMSISMHGQFYLLYCIFSIFIPFFLI